MKPFNLFPYDLNIHFMRLRWVSLIVAAAIMFIGIGAMFTNGFNFDPIRPSAGSRGRWHDDLLPGSDEGAGAGCVETP